MEAEQEWERAESDSLRPAMQVARGLLQGGGPAFLAIDGRCGSGKTFLAARMQAVFGCTVVHMDDFYLPLERRKRDWSTFPGGNMDFERLRREVLLPLRAGKTARYRPFDCQTGQMGEARELLPQALTVVEGSYSMHPAVGICYERKLFLTCSREEQARRIRRREGERMSMFQALWIPLEERYFLQYGIESGSDLVVDTSAGPSDRGDEGRI